MKRLIPATIILVFTISLCICSHILVDRACDNTLKDINDFYNQTINAQSLQNSWQKRKEKMALFVNHSFLDEISLYMGQLAVYNDFNSEYFEHTLKNIQTTLSMIKAEQQLSAHSFY